MPIIGRSHPLPAIISRSQVADFATVKNPVTTVVVAAPYARTWFRGPQATISRSQTADFATVKNPVTVVIQAAPYARTWFRGPQAIFSRSQTADFATVKNPNGLVVTPLNKPQLIAPAILVRNPQGEEEPPPSTATPAPLVYAPVGVQLKFSPPTIARGSLEDFATPVVRPPVVAVSPSPRTVTPQALILRSQVADFAATQNPVTTVVVVPAQPSASSGRIVLSRAPLQDAAIQATAPRQPVIVTPVTLSHPGAQALQSRTSLEDNKGTRPIVVTAPQRPGLGVPAILSRNGAALPLATVAVPPPLVYTPTVPKVWLRGFTLVRFPRGDFIAPPTPGDIAICVFDPIITWYASSPVTDWFAGGPGTGWAATQPEEDCC